MWFGEADADFSAFANLADVSGGKLKTTPFPTVAAFDDQAAIAVGADFREGAKLKGFLGERFGCRFVFRLPLLPRCNGA